MASLHYCTQLGQSKPRRLVRYPAKAAQCFLLVTILKDSFGLTPVIGAEQCEASTWSLQSQGTKTEERKRTGLSSVEQSFSSFSFPLFTEPLPGVLRNTGTGAFIFRQQRCLPEKLVTPGHLSENKGTH